MIKIPYADNHYENSEKTGALRNGYAPCIVCGRAVNVNRTHKSVRVHMGGEMAVTDAEADALNAEGHDNADLGCYPIGPDCLKKNPDLQPYAVRTVGY